MSGGYLGVNPHNPCTAGTAAYIQSHRACTMRQEAKGKIPGRSASKEHTVLESKRFCLEQAGK